VRGNCDGRRLCEASLIAAKPWFMHGHAEPLRRQERLRGTIAAGAREHTKCAARWWSYSNTNASISCRFKQVRAENAPLLAGIAGSWREGQRGMTMKILTFVFAAGAFGGFYVALGERDPWLWIGAAVAFTVLCRATARHSASPVIAPNERHRHPLVPGGFIAASAPAE
jgi:hypothetical protein